MDMERYMGNRSLRLVQERGSGSMGAKRPVEKTVRKKWRLFQALNNELRMRQQGFGVQLV